MVILVLLFLIGMALIGLRFWSPHYPIFDVIADFGVAFVISGILGLTVERYTRKRFTKELAKDVFEATIGHLLPDALQDEMRSIYSQKMICDRHEQHVYLHRMDDSTVKFECEMERHLHNISGEDIDVPIGLGIDEWFGAEPSEIVSFSYKVNEGDRVQLSGGDLIRRHTETGRPTLSINKKGPVHIPKNGRVVVLMKFYEFKPINSDHFSHFTYATKDPRIIVRCDNGIGATVSFPRETEENKVQSLSGTYQYRGLVTPAQEIRVRWWDEARLVDWLDSPPTDV